LGQEDLVKAALVLFVAIVAPVAAFADGVAWQTDYDKAVQLSAKTQKPLLLDFGTESCVYCVKLDKTTFRDPAVIRLLNETFIAVKVDGNREPKLVQALQIDSYPTLVVASPDGKVLAMNPGYLDSNGMMQFLKGGLSKLPAKGEVVDAKPSRELAGEAGELLAQAKKDFADGFYLCCVERCDRISRSHPQASEREAAERLSRQAMEADSSAVMRPR
jgi:thioredoxin-related protein